MIELRTLLQALTIKKTRQNTSYWIKRTVRNSKTLPIQKKNIQNHIKYSDYQ